MTNAGLDAAISPWWGFLHIRDTRFAQLLTVTSKENSSNLPPELIIELG